MFDRVIVAPTQRVYETRTVTEHRAPTDESVKLLREMEAKARDEVLSAVRLEGNGFECVVQQMEDYASNDVIWRAAFSLNGRRMTAEYRANRYDLAPQKVAIGLRDAIAKEISSDALSKAFSKLDYSKISKGVV